MSNFDKLPEIWQQTVNKAIQTSDGGERPDIATAFREDEAGYLLELELEETPSKLDTDDIENSYVDFCKGWEASLEAVKKWLYPQFGEATNELRGIYESFCTQFRLSI